MSKITGRQVKTYEEIT